jgi:hypothetical protein
MIMLLRDFLRTGGTERINPAQLPSYGPDLNPDQGVWTYLKPAELKNVCCRSITELRAELCKAIARLRGKVSVIQGFTREVYRTSPLVSCVRISKCEESSLFEKLGLPESCSADSPQSPLFERHRQVDLVRIELDGETASRKAIQQDGHFHAVPVAG